MSVPEENGSNKMTRFRMQNLHEFVMWSKIAITG